MPLSDPQAPSPRFAADEIPLEGTVAVEASAGTGKTYNITRVYVRLIAEKRLTPEQILVVTYTTAATGELRERLRRALIEAAGEAAQKREDLAGEAASLEEAERIERRLLNAIRTFDEAAIFTIHGFCQRVLAEHAFESGSLIQSEVLTDQSSLLAECFADLWRKEMDKGPEWRVRMLLEAGFDPRKLQETLGPLVGRPFSDVLAGTPESAEDLKKLIEQVASQTRTAEQAWGQQQSQILDLLCSSDLRQNVYKPERVHKLAAEFSDAIQERTLTSPANIKDGNLLHFFSRSKIEKGTKNGAEPPQHGFFDTIEELRENALKLEAQSAMLLSEFLESSLREVREDSVKRKRHRRQRSFEDLLRDLEEALAAPGTGTELRRSLRARYRAALVDEFQDTDALQYSILRKLFGEDRATPLFLVGDPKQAIYAFRGADVYSYLEARDQAGSPHTLLENWRSDESVVAGVNAIFKGQANPFQEIRIPFHEATAHFEDRAASFRSEAGLPPVRAATLPSGSSKPLPKYIADPLAVAWTADEIQRILQTGATIPIEEGRDEKVAAHHFAVLVQNRAQAGQIKEALARRGIPASEASRESIFATDEATEFERILRALCSLSDQRRVRGALATRLLGADARAIADLRNDERDWDAQFQRFAALNDLWAEHGFGRMIRTLMREYTVASNLLEYIDGERRLTNFLQLAELVGRQAAQHSGRDELLHWMAERKRHASTGDQPPDEHLLRIESDERLVQIHTVHISKGLQYPIVFLPFAWRSRGQGGDRADSTYAVFHARAEEGNVATPGPRDGRPCLDLGGPEFAHHKELESKEALAESVRLLYVALTRAQFHCSFVYASPPTGEETAIHKLLGDDLEGAVARSGEMLASTSIESTPILSTPSIAERGDATDSSTLGPARVLHRPVRRRWRITSFSALRGGHRGMDRRDRDDMDSAATSSKVVEEDGIFAFPRGARVGLCLHAIFEHLDFATEDPTESVRAALEDWRLGTEWTGTISRMVREVLETDLDGQGLRLRDLPARQRRDELEFHFPAGKLSVEELNALLRGANYPTVPDSTQDETLPRPLVDGYVKGYIDLVFEWKGRFYLADYKSNHLGASLENYGQEELQEAMRRELYGLQYTTYTLALHRYLKLRIPDYDYERHMGGAYYLFLRGMRAEHGSRYGVFFDRPPHALISEMDARIGRTQGGPE
jgi:exodeoxyribonuclease V beta subunit